jgi:hypothetical protein
LIASWAILETGAQCKTLSIDATGETRLAKCHVAWGHSLRQQNRVCDIGRIEIESPQPPVRIGRRREVNGQL